MATQLESTADGEAVLRLLLDDRDTAVTLRTALALLERRDRLGLELIATADAQADDDTSQSLYDAVTEFQARALGGG
jgi:hypothetical protein